MSKRGGGRGMGNMTLNIEAIGFGRGDQLPAPTLQPPPTHPPLRQQPVPILSGEGNAYVVALKNEYIQTMQCSPYYITAEKQNGDIKRYSDKYIAKLNVDTVIEWQPDWRRLPMELQIAVRKKNPKIKGIACKRKASGGDVGIKNKLKAIGDQLKVPDENDKKAEDKSSEKDDESENDDADDIVENEEDDEEVNDYMTPYFDNGESYLDEEDDTLDDAEGGVY